MKLNFLMSFKFHLIQVGCPDAKVNLISPHVHTLRSCLDDCHWFPPPASGACILTHLLPSLNFHTLDCGLLSSNGWPNFTALPESWHRLQMHRVAQGPLTPLAWVPAWPSGVSKAGASHSSHPPSCLQDTGLHWGLFGGFFDSSRPHLLTYPSLTVSYLLPRTKPKGTARSQHAVVVAQKQFTHRHTEELVNWQEQTGMLRISDMHLDNCHTVWDKEEHHRNGDFILSVPSKLLKSMCQQHKPAHAEALINQSSVNQCWTRGWSSWGQEMKRLIWLMTFWWDLAL